MIGILSYDDGGIARYVNQDVELSFMPKLGIHYETFKGSVSNDLKVSMDVICSGDVLDFLSFTEFNDRCTLKELLRADHIDMYYANMLGSINEQITVFLFLNAMLKDYFELETINNSTDEFDLTTEDMYVLPHAEALSNNISKVYNTFGDFRNSIFEENNLFAKYSAYRDYLLDYLYKREHDLKDVYQIPSVVNITSMNPLVTKLEEYSEILIQSDNLMIYNLSSLVYRPLNQGLSGTLYGKIEILSERK